MRRRLKVAIGFAVVAVTAAGAVYLTFREDDIPDRSRYPVRGIDVSHHQGAIDWEKVVADDVAFAYVKVSEGGDHRDREFVRNISEANRLGLPVGAYHFFTFCRPPADQAQNFIDALALGDTQLPPMVDLEFHGNCDRRPSPEEMGQEVTTFLDMVESRIGRTLIYYTPDSFLEAYGEVLPPRRLWRRSIQRTPEQSDWTIWQYRATGRVAGIDGDVDLNVLSVALEDLTKADGRGARETKAGPRG